jgi:DNA repair protein RadC
MRTQKKANKISLLQSVPEKLTMLSSIETVAALCLNVWDKETISNRESLYVFYLTSQLKVVNCEMLAIGTETSCHVDIDKIISNAYMNGVKRIIIAHNHPNGTTSPSDKDMDVTNRLSIRCALEGIELVEHIIITPQKGYLSF